MRYAVITQDEGDRTEKRFLMSEIFQSLERVAITARFSLKPEVVELHPLGGMPAWDDNAVQFPRLLAEIYAAGLTGKQETEICASMSLHRDDLYDLLEQADREWERLKRERAPTNPSSGPASGAAPQSP